MAITIDAGDIAKIATAFGSLGGGFAFVKTFADRLFTFWLERMRARAEISDAKERALERIAVGYERVVGVLENIVDRLDRTDAKLERVDRRQGRVEAHLGLSGTPSDLPPPKHDLPTENPRRQLTDPGLGAPVGAPPSRPSGQAAPHE